MKAVKKNIEIIGIMILLLFVLSACGNNELSNPEVGDINSTEANDGLFSKYDNQEPEDIVEDEETEKERVERYWDKAKDELERTDEPVDESEEHMAMLAGDMKELFDYLSQDFFEIEGDFTSSISFAKSIAGQSESWIGDNMSMIMNVGYQLAPETAEWFYSDTDGIYQFAVSVKSEEPEKEDIVISGNYNIEVKKFKIFNISGNLNFPEFSP